MAHENSLDMEIEGVRALVDEERLCVLGTLDPTGPPFAESVPCAMAGEELTFTLAAGSQSDRNIQEDPRVCAVIENAENNFYEVRSATVRGTARRLGEVGDRSAQRASGGIGARHTVSYALALDDVTSFDFSKIQVKH